MARNGGAIVVEDEENPYSATRIQPVASTPM